MGYLDSAGLSYLWGKVKASLAGKQDTIAAGDGIDITETAEGPKIGVTTPVRGIVTQAEFDALPEAERNKGLYVISDGGYGGGGGGGGSSWEVYSTEETRIGTWIDGKPLYRKCFTASSGGVNSNYIFADVSSLNIDSLASLTGSITNTVGQRFHIPATLQSGSGYFILSADQKLIFYTTSAGLAERPFFCILEYTKTTDEGGAA